MTRIFIDENLQDTEAFAVTGDTAHYLGRVLRMQPGDCFIAVDATGREFQVRVAQCGDDSLTVSIEAEARVEREAPVELDLYAAVLKGRRFDLVVQKCSELGAARIIPVITRRAIARPGTDRATNKAQRWQKIAEEACRQCGRVRIPEISIPLPWDRALTTWQASGAPGIIPCEALAGSREHSLRAALNDLKQTPRLAAFIGPEGGFAPEETDHATAAGLRPVSLGPRILRAETAAITVCAIALYELEGPQ